MNWARNTTDWKSTSGFMFKVSASSVFWWTKNREHRTSYVNWCGIYIIIWNSSGRNIVVESNTRTGSSKMTFVIYEDNQPCIAPTKKWEHKRLKHVNKQWTEIKYISTKHQVADILAKNLKGEQFFKLRKELNYIKFIKKHRIQNTYRMRGSVKNARYTCYTYIFCLHSSGCLSWLLGWYCDRSECH